MFGLVPISIARIDLPPTTFPLLLLRGKNHYGGQLKSNFSKKKCKASPGSRGVHWESHRWIRFQRVIWIDYSVLSCFGLMILLGNIQAGFKDALLSLCSK